MKRVVVVIVPTAFVVAASCSEPSDRAPPAPNCLGVTCGGGPGPGTSGGSDAGGETTATDALTDGAFEVGDGGVSVGAMVRPLNSFTDDPDKAGTFDLVSLSVRAPRAGGGTDVEATTANVEGVFTLNGVAPAVGAATYFQVWKTGVHRTLAAVVYRPDTTFNLPLFKEDLQLNAWNMTTPATIYPTGASTIVVHVFGPGGARLAGVKAALTGTGRGPLYDDGADITPLATATGSRGTIVFIGITASTTFRLDMFTSTKTYPSVNLALASNAVTHAAFVLE